jgi:hypothetical protein
MVVPAATNRRSRSRMARVATGIQDTVGERDKHREPLQVGVIGRNVAHTHKEVLDTLDVDAHDLWNKLTDLVLLSSG